MVFKDFLSLVGRILGSSWTRLGPCLGHLGAILGHLGAFLGLLGAIFGHPGAMLANVGAILGVPADIWGPPWCIVGPLTTTYYYVLPRTATNYLGQTLSLSTTMDQGPAECAERLNPPPPALAGE